ncbi:hypothetical protein BQ8420_24815 [Nocardiopsis sp. JB363]|nr:hypothetical protein BQ8420_24815 [Nocardiopsis sp. JB363]
MRHGFHRLLRSRPGRGCKGNSRLPAPYLCEGRGITPARPVHRSDDGYVGRAGNVPWVRVCTR